MNATALLARTPLPVARTGDDADHAAFGIADLDALLGGGLRRGALHEIFAAGDGDLAAAAGFALALAHLAGRARPLLWVRQDFIDHEAGRLYPPGLIEFGLDPRRVVLARAKDGLGVLRAGAESVRCAALGAVLIELWGETPALDAIASRRLSLAAKVSGVTILLLRTSARPTPGSAQTRWQVRSHSSHALAANAPGFPVIAATLTRQRSGPADRTWMMEWNRDRQCFADCSPAPGTALSGAGLSVSEPRTLASSAGPADAPGWLSRAG